MLRSGYSPKFVKKNNIKTKKITNPAVIRNADGTANNAGRVTEKIEASMRYLQGAHRSHDLPRECRCNLRADMAKEAQPRD